MEEKILASALQWLRDNHDFGASKSTRFTTVKTLQDDGMDSLDREEMAMHVEEECGVEIKDDWLDDFERNPNLTLAEIAMAISDKLKN